MNTEIIILFCGASFALGGMVALLLRRALVADSEADIRAEFIRRLGEAAKRERLARAARPTERLTADGRN